VKLQERSKRKLKGKKGKKKKERDELSRKGDKQRLKEKQHNYYKKRRKDVKFSKRTFTIQVEESGHPQTRCKATKGLHQHLDKVNKS